MERLFKNDLFIMAFTKMQNILKNETPEIMAEKMTFKEAEEIFVAACENETMAKLINDEERLKIFTPFKDFMLDVLMIKAKEERKIK